MCWLEVRFLCPGLDASAGNLLSPRLTFRVLLGLLAFDSSFVEVTILPIFVFVFFVALFLLLFRLVISPSV